MKLNVKTLPHFEGLMLPSYQTPGSAGLDLPAAINADEPIILHPKQWQLIPTGIAIALPEGFEAQVRPRSGLAARHAISCVNAPGTVDADYRGELKVNLINHGNKPFIVERGARIAQMVIAPVIQIQWLRVEVLDDTQRGSDGFGSTGV